MGNVKIKISYYPRDVHRTTTSYLVLKVDYFFEKTLESLKISSGRGEVENVPSSKGKNANILAPGP